MSHADFQHMLSAKIKKREHYLKLRFPLLASRKYDGIRLAKIPGRGVLTRSLKVVPNVFVQEVLADPIYDWLDFEIIVGEPNTSDTYRTTMSGVMSQGGYPDFRIYTFDNIQHPSMAFAVRHKLVLDMGEVPRMIPVEHILIRDFDEMDATEERFCQEGYEGMMLRKGAEEYKFGRSTLLEQGLIALVRYETDEATIVGFEELEHNDNEAKINARGRTERSSHKANMRPGDTLGRLILRHETKWNRDTFGCGSGFSAALKKEIWDNQDKWMGEVVTFKYRPYGSYEAPRFPIFKGLRDKLDMS
jgi:DNA ligase-1